MSSAGNDGGRQGPAGAGGQAALQELMQQWWQAWSAPAGNAAAGQAGSAHAAGPDATQAWQALVQQWSAMVGQNSGPDAAAAGARFDQQAAGWYGTMQEVAARFAGRDTTSAEVANAWRDALQGQGEQAFRSMLDAARGSTQWGNDPWMRDMTSLLEAISRESGPWMQAPAFGPGRVHQARWQQLARLQQEYQAHSQAYADQIRAALDDAFALFEQRLAEHEAPGSQLTSARALFDLWIDVAEEAYAKVAMSGPFQQVYADFANAQMRLRAAIQAEVEQVGQSVGLPTRSEMDTAHRRIVELERQVRRLAQRLDGMQAGAPADAPGAAGQAVPDGPAPKAATPAASKKAPKTPVKKTAAAKAPAKPAPKAKPAARTTVSRSGVPGKASRSRRST